MTQNPSEYVHRPVLVDEVVSYLITEKSGAYVDGTAGLGGHLKALAANLNPDARLYGIDKDDDALTLARERLKESKQKVEFVKGTYDDIEEIADSWTDKTFDGALLDLGLSSLQLDDPKRGFSFESDSPLDMRFDHLSDSRTAADLVNELGEKELARIIKEFGEERRANPVAAAIVRERQKGMIGSNSQLAQIVKKVVRPPHQNKSLARVFQALRIAVNNELATLQSAIPKFINVLNKGGRLVIISYHSLEDRIVKQAFKESARACNCPTSYPHCICGANQQLKIITKRPVYPTDKEINLNSRARSARLRVAEKII